MLQTTFSSPPTPSASPEPVATQRRMDPAHPPNRPPDPPFENRHEGPDPDDSERPLDGPIPAKVDIQQLEHHAEQLAEFLRLKQRDLDRRESQLNAQLGLWEKSERAGRLQLDERRQALDEREMKIARGEEELARRTAALAAAEVASEQAAATAKQLNDRCAAELDIREQRLVEREQHFDALREKLRDAERRLNASQQKWQQQITCEHQQLMTRRAELQQQQRYILRNLERHREALDQQPPVFSATTKPTAELESPPEPKPAPAPEKTAQKDQSHDDRPSPSVNKLHQALADQLTEFNRRMRALEQERELWLAQKTVEEQRLEQWATALKVRLDKREQRLREQRQSLERMQRLLARERHEALKIHGETLELRLAVEHVWSQLSALADPVEFSRTIEQVRSDLQQHYALQKQEIQQLLEKSHIAAQQLDERQRRLETSRAQWQSWLDAQHKNLEARTTQLDARQRQLDSQHVRWKRPEIGQTLLPAPSRKVGPGYSSSTVPGAGATCEHPGRWDAKPPTKNGDCGPIFLSGPTTSVNTRT